MYLLAIIQALPYGCSFVGVLIPLFYGTGLSKFENNSTDLFNKVTVK